jgi:hypothetical protein
MRARAQWLGVARPLLWDEAVIDSRPWRSPMMRKLGLICSLAVALFFSPSVSSAQDAAVTFSGVLNEHVRVGATVAQGRVMFFLCGDAETVATESRWLVGPTQTWIEKNGVHVWARWHAAQNLLEAYIVIEGRWTRWVARPFTDGRGLYRADTEHGTLGVIVTDAAPRDGELELQGAVKSGDLFSQIIPVSSKIEVVRGELEVNVPVVGGGFSKAVVKQVDVIDL